MTDEEKYLNNDCEDYSKKFDWLRLARVMTSRHKYGPARQNFKTKNVDALGSMERCIAKYRETKNTEYLCDAANYIMFEFMFPQIDGAYFKPTGSGESAGIVGMSVKEMEEFKENGDY